MKKRNSLLLVICLTVVNLCCGHEVAQALLDTEETIFEADNSMFQYIGRIDFSKPKAPRFWSPGVYITARFEGTSCEVLINDEILWGKSHNYVSVVIDSNPPKRIKLAQVTNMLKFEKLSRGVHSILICKSTESQIGYIEFAGLKCQKLFPVTNVPTRKMEFYGDSITSGMSNDESEYKCGEGEWYDQHNAYASYGAITARTLHAQWMLSSVSGIGLMHSCCDMKITMPEVFDRLDMSGNKGTWNFSYQPDVVTICLGQNDGVQDSLSFCSKYVSFLKKIRSKYPNATLICMTSPMADDTLNRALQSYLAAVVADIQENGDKRVYKFFYKGRYTGGCGWHPNITEHVAMAEELSTFIKQTLNW